MKRFIAITLGLIGMSAAGQTPGDDLPTASDAPASSQEMVIEVTESTPEVILITPPDSITLSVPSDSIRLHDPRKAVWMSAVCPGLGQAYNRKYWKIPIIYGAFMGLGYGVAWNNQYYKDYRYGYIDFLKGEPNITWEQLVPSGRETDANYMAWVKKVLKNKRDRYRRYRDMSIFGLAAVYVLNLIDAFVDAQLMDFDISQDLSMNISPVVNDLPENVGRGKSVGVMFRLNF